MFKNVVGQSLYQLTVLLVILIYGSEIFNISYSRYDPLYPTAEQVLENPEEGWTEQEPTDRLVLYTIIFQVFIFMQLFNLINSRKVNTR